MNDNVILSVRSLTVLKKGVEMLHAIDLDFLKGEIHAIVGDHNAGKSLLADVISGAAKYHGGEVIYQRKVLRSYSPVKASKLSIACIHQNPTVFNYLSMLENIFPKKVIPHRSSKKKAAMTELAEEKLRVFGVGRDLQIPIGRCSDSEILIVYIVRGLCSSCKVLILDEIGTRLSAAQIEILQSELSVLRERGVTVIYFTSNLEEVYHFANKVSFLQNGRLLATEVASNLGKLELVQLSYSHLYSRKELERSNYELFYLKNYYENIINSMPIPLLLLNSQRKIIYVNNRFGDRFAVAKEKYIGRDVADIFRPGSMECEHFTRGATEDDSRPRLFSNAVLSIGNSRESHNLYKIPIYDQDKSYLGSILFFDTKSIHVDLEQYNKDSQAQRRVPLFAHEIRNPLGILSNFLTLIREKSSSQEIRDYLVRSETEIKRINSIISNLIKEQGVVGEPTNPAATNLWALTEEISYLFMPMIADNRIVILNKTDRDLQLGCNEDELKEVLINLVLNAIEAITMDGMVMISNDSEKLNEKAFVVIRVKDNGKGVESRNREKIFEPFFSTKTGKERRGLGLAICKDIVDSWGGMITVDSTIDVGSTFSIFLPMGDASIAI